MRIAEAPPRSWLLAVLAAWALCVWLLALSGMGGGIDRLDPDPALLRPLPADFQPGEERLGVLQQYAESARRPLFTDDRRPQPFVIDPDAEAGQGSFDFVLTSVLRTPTLQMAILQPSGGGRSLGVKVGESPEGVAGWSLTSVESRAAVFNGPEGEVRLALRQFDGVGGEPPTPMAVTPPEQAVMEGPQMPVEGGAGPGAAAVAPPGVVTDASGMPVPEAENATPETMQPAPAAADQVEAIRKRIEERRARLRQQSLQGRQGDQTP